MEEKINIIALHLGYCEDASTASLIFATHQGSTENREHALLTLAEDMYAYYRSTLPGAKPCCTDAISNKQTYCPDCGSRIDSIKNDSYYEFTSFLWDLMTTNAETYEGYEYVQWSRSPFPGEDTTYCMRWRPAWPSEIVEYNSKTLFIAESGEKVLAYMLKNKYPDRLQDYDSGYDIDRIVKESKVYCHETKPNREPCKGCGIEFGWTHMAGCDYDLDN